MKRFKRIVSDWNGVYLVSIVFVMVLILGAWRERPSQDLRVPQCYIIKSLETWTERVRSEDGYFTQKYVHMHSVALQKLGLTFNIRQSTPEWPEALLCFYFPRDSS